MPARKRPVFPSYERLLEALDLVVRRIESDKFFKIQWGNLDDLAALGYLGLVRNVVAGATNKHPPFRRYPLAVYHLIFRAAEKMGVTPDLQWIRSHLLYLEKKNPGDRYDGKPYVLLFLRTLRKGVIRLAQEEEV